MELAENPGQISQRIIDLVAPIGKGQRGMIVSPPKAGKTTIMKQIANSITSNNPECHLIVLLVDERPEEVTDMQRSVEGEIVYSTFDRPSEDHIQASGTRKEELLLSQEELALVWKLRRVLHALDGTAALELLVDKMRQTKGNMQFLKEIQKVQIGD